MRDEIPLWGHLLINFVVGTAVIWVCLICLSGVSDREWRKDAVAAGHAEFYLDKDNNRQWRWLPLDKEGAKRE